MNKLRSRIKANSAKKSVSGNSPADDQVLRDVVENLGRVALGCGYTADQLSEIAHTQWHKLPATAPRSDAAEIVTFRDAPHVLTHWHFEPEYLDDQGQPLPLAMSGGGQTIETLVKLVNPELNTARVVRHLFRYGAYDAEAANGSRLRRASRTEVIRSPFTGTHCWCSTACCELLRTT